MLQTVLKLIHFPNTKEKEEEKEVNQILTHLKDNEKVLLKQLAGKIPKRGIILEVGSYVGASASFLALGCRKKSGRVYCVDTWKNEAMSEGLRDTYAEFLENTRHFRDVIIPMCGKSVDIARTFDKKIDLLFIDADHSYDACQSDVKAWIPHLKSGAIVVFHDYSWAEGVKRTVLELIKPIEKVTGEILENIYWTIV